MEKLDLTTPNFTDENIQKLSELFPNCVTESSDGKSIDFDALKQELSSNIVEGNKERYRLTWPGKAESLVAANTPINKTLRPAREESKDFDNTENLYIEGDNLEVLKLLQETYLGKIKMIYIDPPYNTGKDFVYKDNFTQDKAEYDEESGSVDEEGGRLVSNPDSNGRYHSDWLSMMYPRLKLARNLLKDDGVIFISINDNEVHNLRKLCDDLFGMGNFISCFIWNQRTTGGHDSKDVNIVHEYIIAYAKSNIERGNVLNLIDSGTQYPELDEDNGRRFKWDSLWTVSHGYTENCDYDIQAPDGTRIRPYACHSDGEIMQGVARWFWSYETFIERKSELNIKKVNGIWKVYKRVYGGSGTPIKSIFDKSVVGGTSEGKSLLVETLNARNIFDNPKSSKLLMQLLERINDNETILDFFSGSATSAHAVMQLNAEDNGNRKFIMAQIPEATDEKSEAYKANYKTIAEIGKERIRRAGEKIKKDNADKEGVDNLDIGFRVLKVDSPNMKDVYFSPDNTSQDDMFDLASNIKDDRTDEDLLFMVLLDWGIDLSVKIELKEVAGKAVYFADGDFLAACFTENLNEDFVKTLVAEKPRKVVLRDSGFASSSVKINVEQIFKQANIEVKVI